MIIDFFDIFGFTALILQFIFAFYLFSIKKGRFFSNRILAFYFLLGSFKLFAEYSWQYAEYLLPDFAFIFTIGDGTAFFFGPLLYFYTRSIIEKNFKFRLIHLLNIIPYLAFLTVTIFKFHLNDNQTKVELIYTGAAIGYEFVIASLLTIDLQVIIYTILSLSLIKKNNTELKKYYSSTRELNLSWLKLIFAGFITFYGIEIISFVLYKLLQIPAFIPGLIGIILNFVVLIFIVLIIFNGLKNPQLFAAAETEEEKKKYKSSKLTESDSYKYLMQLEALMKSEKPYLNPSVSLSEIANELNIPQRHLSQIINEKLEKNFYDFVNNYRIDEAKNLLINPKHSKKTVLEILYDSGFNSKSVFNTTFKKLTGLTPTEFRKEYAT